jgi:ribosomal protein S18 acetylase RimI-like enzyme
MAEIEIRPAISSDIPELMRFDHSIETTHIWQIETMKDEKEMNIHFLETRLPRPLTLAYPKIIEEMSDTWTKHSLFLTARMDAKLVGYMILAIEKDTRTAMITDLVVDSVSRNLGIASGLIISIRNSLRNQGVRKLTIAVPVRNQAAISLAKKMKMEFCGYIDHYFINQDAALLFSTVIK